MSHSSGKITAPVDVVADIATVLGRASGDVGQLCGDVMWDSTNQQWVRAGAINPASKYKPFCYNAWGFADASAHLTALRAKNCGLTMKQYGNVGSAFADGIAANVGDVVWIHDVPRGLTFNEQYRVLDFNGYDHSAGWGWQYGVSPNPAYQLDSPSFQEQTSSFVDITMADLNGNGANGQTTNYRYYNLNGLNWGVAYRERGTTGIVTAIIFAAESTPSTDLPTGITLISEKEYDFVFFFTSASVTSGWVSEGEVGNGNFYLGPSPHSIWHYTGLFGAEFYQSEYSVNMRTLTIKGRATGKSRYYYKMVLKMTISGTTTSYEFLNTPGTLGTDSWTTLGTVSNSTPWTGNEVCQIQWWIDSTTYRTSGNFVPITPINP